MHVTIRGSAVSDILDVDPSWYSNSLLRTAPWQGPEGPKGAKGLTGDKGPRGIAGPQVTICCLSLLLGCPVKCSP
jgi:hypothetical protein